MGKEGMPKVEYSEAIEGIKRLEGRLVFLDMAILGLKDEAQKHIENPEKKQEYEERIKIAEKRRAAYKKAIADLISAEKEMEEFMKEERGRA